MKRKTWHRELIQPGRGPFLTAVFWYQPKVLQDLEHNVLPVAKARKPFETELQAWGKRWKLEYPWILDAARGEVRLWVRYGGVAKVGDRPIWHYPSGSSPLVFTRRERAFVFRDDGWPIDRAVARESFIRDITARFNARLAEYCDHIERLASAPERGIRLPAGKRRRPQAGDQASLFDHYHWLARVHLRLAKPRELAAEAGVTLRAVQDALQRTREEIGLQLPPRARRAKRQTRTAPRGPQITKYVRHADKPVRP